MKFALLINEDHSIYQDEDSWTDIVRRHGEFGAAHSDAIVGGEGLKGPDTATTVQQKGGETLVHDGPFAEAREQLGGFYLVDVPSLDEALAIAKAISLAGDGSIEVRPCISNS